jgi:hypothetical protein
MPASSGFVGQRVTVLPGSAAARAPHSVSTSVVDRRLVGMGEGLHPSEVQPHGTPARGAR